jgi:hypothetical protein
MDSEYRQRLINSLSWLVQTVTWQAINATGKDYDSPEVAEARILIEALQEGVID